MPPKFVSFPPSVRPHIYLILVLITTIVVYWPGLAGPLLLDDVPNLHHLQKYGEGAISLKEVFYLSSHGMTRPLSILSFIGNWVTTGENIWFLKFTNLVIHLLCGVLIYRISCLLLVYDFVNKASAARNIAVWITALWLLSPFLLSTVLYVIQRMAQLSAFFTLCGLLFYIKGRIKYGENQSSGTPMLIVSILLFWPLATLSKQNGLLLPLLLLIVEFFFFYKDSNLVHIKKLRTILISLSLLPGLIICGWVMIAPESLIGDYQERSFSLYERLLTQPRVLLDYIGNLLLLPIASPMSLFHDDYPKSTALLTPVTTLPSLIICILALLSAFSAAHKKTGTFLFGIIFFFAAHLVESTFIPLELYFEHRNYLPAFGIYFSIVTGTTLLLSKLKTRNFAIIALLIVPFTFSVYTYQRSVKWQKLTSIFFMSEITHPESPRLNEGIAFLYLLIHDSNAALHYLDKVSVMDDKQHPPEFYFKYLLAYCQAKKAMPEEDYPSKFNITSLSNDLTTVNYFRVFVDNVEANKCDSLDLNKITARLKLAVENRNHHYDLGLTSHVNILLDRLLIYLRRDKEQKALGEP